MRDRAEKAEAELARLKADLTPEQLFVKESNRQLHEQIADKDEMIKRLEIQLKAAEKVIEAANNLHKEHRCPVDNCTKQIIFTNLKAKYDAESTLRSPGTGS